MENSTFSAAEVEFFKKVSETKAANTSLLDDLPKKLMSEFLLFKQYTATSDFERYLSQLSFRTDLDSRNKSFQEGVKVRLSSFSVAFIQFDIHLLASLPVILVS